MTKQPKTRHVLNKDERAMIIKALEISALEMRMQANVAPAGSLIRSYHKHALKIEALAALLEAGAIVLETK